MAQEVKENPLEGIDWAKVKAELEAERELLKDAEPVKGQCGTCHRTRTIYPTDAESWSQGIGICGTCRARRERRQNASEMWRGRYGRRGY